MDTINIFKPGFEKIISTYNNLELELRLKEEQLDLALSPSQVKIELQSELKVMAGKINRLNTNAKNMERKLI